MTELSNRNLDAPIWKPTLANIKIHLLAIAPGDKEMQELARLTQDKLCRVGDPEGPIGTIRRAFKRAYRFGAIARFKVELQSGAIRYLDAHDTYCF